MNPVEIAKLSFGQLAFLVALFLPGFMSIKIDRLVHPGDDLKAPELLIETLGYSIINAGLLFWPIIAVFQQLASPKPNIAIVWPLAALICVAGPTAWPFVFRAFQRFGARRGWLLRSYIFPWDEFFTRREACWIIVHLIDGGLIGGYMGDRSLASLAPQSGHLYIEELWTLDEHGRFTEAVNDSKGALLRPQDYRWVEMFLDKERP